MCASLAVLIDVPLNLNYLNGYFFASFYFLTPKQPFFRGIAGFWVSFAFEYLLK